VRTGRPVVEAVASASDISVEVVGICVAADVASVATVVDGPSVVVALALSMLVCCASVVAALSVGLSRVPAVVVGGHAVVTGAIVVTAISAVVSRASVLTARASVK